MSRLAARRKIGLYNLRLDQRGGGEKRTLVLADDLSRDHDVYLLTNEPADLAALGRYFGVDLSRVRVVLLRRYPKWFVRAVRGWHVRVSLFAAQLEHYFAVRARRLDVFLNMTFGSDLIAPARCGVYMCMFPQRPTGAYHPARWYGRLAHRLLDGLERLAFGRRVADALASYAVITANSRFTAEWVGRRWGRPADVVYTVCEDMGPPAPKEKLILTVGRFQPDWGGTFQKRQDRLLEVFRGLTAAHQAGWELCFAGSVPSRPAARRLVDGLIRAATGLPVRFALDVPVEELRTLYQRAAVYWHATGYGSPPDERPENQEHFGQTTVEAMSAGAVPVVIGTGGQPEIVTHGVDGYLWDDLAGLARYTERLIADPNELARLGAAAVAASRRFGRAAFIARVREVLGRLPAR
jgi:glycosyltransferase involved in cell wall biosynthesis